MKYLNKIAPVFNPAAQTLDFSAMALTAPAFDIRALLAVVDVTANTMIYGVGISGLGSSSVNGAVVTLQFNTTALGASDQLAVWYDDGLGNGADAAGLSPFAGGLGIQGYLSSLFALANNSGPQGASEMGLAMNVKSNTLNQQLKLLVAEMQAMNTAMAASFGFAEDLAQLRNEALNETLTN